MGTPYPGSQRVCHGPALCMHSLPCPGQRNKPHIHNPWPALRRTSCLGHKPGTGSCFHKPCPWGGNL
eukprot:9534228-Karenia_brevis.AAC.1